MPGPYYTLESLEADNSVGYLIKRCGILMTQIAEERFESQPISFTQWVILMHLTRHQYQSPTEISTHIGYDMGALTRIVDDLYEQKLVHRERSDHDRRAVQIALTPEGRRLALATKAAVLDLVNDLVAPYAKADVDVLISLLQRLLVHMETVAGRLAAEAAGAGGKKPAGRRSSRNAVAKPQATGQRTRRRSAP
jgi:DNA-binding MarR family transcriptional regulator